MVRIVAEDEEAARLADQMVVRGPPMQLPHLHTTTQHDKPRHTFLSHHTKRLGTDVGVVWGMERWTWWEGGGSDTYGPSPFHPCLCHTHANVDLLSSFPLKLCFCSRR